MSELLVYQTSDPRFADRAIEAMTEANIPCFQTGRGWVDISRAVLPDLGGGICIYIRDAVDAARANAILIELGAVIETPPKLPSRRVIFLIVLIVTVLVVYVTTYGN
jgi:hypothetical protein